MEQPSSEISAGRKQNIGLQSGELREGRTSYPRGVMEDNPDTKTDRSEKILDALADYIESAPGEELLDDARREGRDLPQDTPSTACVSMRQSGSLPKEGAHTRTDTPLWPAVLLARMTSN